MDTRTPDLDLDERQDSEESPTDCPEIKLGYLLCPQDASKSYLGAFLVTDSHTRPLHFSWVAPVRPTTLQRILYGSTLIPHIKLTIVGETLLKSWNGDLDALFVDSSELLPLSALTSAPTATLQKVDSTEPGTLSAYHYDMGESQDRQERMGRIVARLEQDVDLLDPFERARAALKEVLKGDASQ